MKAMKDNSKIRATLAKLDYECERCSEIGNSLRTTATDGPYGYKDKEELIDGLEELIEHAKKIKSKFRRSGKRTKAPEEVEPSKKLLKAFDDLGINE